MIGCKRDMNCVKGTQDAEFHPDLNIPTAQLIIRKGFHAHIDSLWSIVEFNGFKWLLTQMIGCKRDMIIRVPVLSQDDIFKLGLKMT
jgi:hypothetical protein